MGFKNLFGIELQPYAIEIAKKHSKEIYIVQGNLFDIPFKDGFFDLVYTSGVLIHISPDDIHRAMKEIHRCSSRYIWGFEYFAEEYTEVTYRGNDDLLWKTDFAKLFLDTFDDVSLVKEKKYQYLTDDNVDSVYLLEKKK